MMTTAVAAAALWRAEIRALRLPPAGVTLYLGTILMLCKSLASLLYFGCLVSLIRWMKPRFQLRVATILVAITLSYPLLRVADLVPINAMIDVARSISDDRAESLKVRFDQDQRLLVRASQRLLFGWGRFGRSRVYNEYGKDISITDGAWIITIGQFGLFGFLAEFGLLALPIFRAAAAFRFTQSASDRILLAALALVLAVNIFDLLPNASLSPWTWLVAGSLLGRAEALRAAMPKRGTNKLSSQPGILGSPAERRVG
jgi:hypothetical protein